MLATYPVCLQLRATPMRFADNSWPPAARLCEPQVFGETKSQAWWIGIKSGIDGHQRLSGHLSMISHTKQAVASTEIAASF